MLKSESDKGVEQQQHQQQEASQLLVGTEYAQKKFGKLWYQFYVKDNRTGLFDFSTIL